jgi:hypothetical protein
MVALVTDPDLLAQGSEITLTKTASPPTVDLNAAGDLASAKVKLQCLYTWFIDETADDADLMKLTPPIAPIDATTFELNVWEFADDDARKKVARGGWNELNSSAVSKQQWSCIQAIGDVQTDTAAYYILSSVGTPTAFSTNGLPEEAVKIYGDASHGNFDRRSDELTIYYRRQGYTLASVAVRDTYGLTALEAKNYIVSLVSTADANIQATDVEIDANSDGVADVSPYSAPTLTYYPGTGFTAWANATTYAAGAVVSSGTPTRWYRTVAGGTSSGTSVADDVGVTWVAFGGEVEIGGSYYPFSYVINNVGAACDRYELYTLAHFWCRQTIEVDEGDAIVGQTLPELLGWDGTTLVTTQGVGIVAPQATDVNDIEQVDATGTTRTEPYVAAGTLRFDATIVADANARYALYYLWGTTSAVIVNDANSDPISGEVDGNADIAFSFDYDGNTQGGHTAGTDMAVTLVVVGKGTAGWSTPVSGTIARSTENQISAAGVRDRVYYNPA